MSNPIKENYTKIIIKEADNYVKWAHAHTYINIARMYCSEWKMRY